MDDDVEDWSHLKDLSRHDWHGKVVITVPSYEETNPWGDRMWQAVALLQVHLGWDICVWNYWETDTLFEISWCSDKAAARDTVIQCLKSMRVPKSPHFYECYSPRNRMIQPWDWKEL